MVELMVAIGIVAILAAIVFSITSSAREVTYQMQCALNLRQLANVSLLYANDNSLRIPPLLDDISEDYWYDSLHSYIGRAAGKAGRFQPGEADGNPWWCPTPTRDPSDRRYTYGINRITGYKASPIQLGQRRLSDSAPATDIPNSLSQTAWYADILYGAYFAAQISTERFFDWAHRGHANVVFMDGSVRKVKDPGFANNPGLILEPEWQVFFGISP